MTSSNGQGSAPVGGYIVGRCPVRLWGLSSEERLGRQLKNAGVTLVDDAGGGLFEASSVVLLRADYLYDSRTVQDLVARPGTLLETRLPNARNMVAVGAHVPSGLFAIAQLWLAGEVGAEDLPETRVETADSLSHSYVQKLLKSEPPVVLPIRPENLRVLERHLFEGSYKGVTDLVTKWVWPRPARWVTGILAGAAIRPNVVTLVGLGLVIAVAGLFAVGRYELGLLLAWTMTFLDTVDGKLARVTVASTSLGHFLDHGTDIVHPPFWYIAWGYGLATTPFALGSPALERVLLSIVAMYVLGRLIEGAFNIGLAKFSMFSWRPIDSYFRLIMARRNPNLLLLSAAVIAGRPDWGLIAVAAWTVASTVFLAVRLTMAAYARAMDGPLRPWLAGIRAGDGNVSAVARPFARQAFEPDLSLLDGMEVPRVSATREGRRRRGDDARARS